MLKKKSLHFNKYQTDARNLLGLIYYEMGESSRGPGAVGHQQQPAATGRTGQSIIFMRSRDKPGRLEAESVNIKKYNQGLFHAPEWQ